LPSNANFAGFLPIKACGLVGLTGFLAAIRIMRKNRCEACKITMTHPPRHLQGQRFQLAEQGSCVSSRFCQLYVAPLLRPRHSSSLQIQQQPHQQVLPRRVLIQPEVAVAVVGAR
jgi:hypothetical protein